MAGLDRAVASIRQSIRRGLSDVTPGRHVLVACSGGADSMALAAGTAFVAREAGWQVGALIVDHGLQEHSADVAADVAERLSTHSAFRGIETVDVLRVDVGSAGGPEGAARAARHTALRAAAEQRDAVVLLGHTRDDQAETVLLGLARGSGLRSLAGMQAQTGPFRRPLLDVRRSSTAAACQALGIVTWLDPHNEDLRFRRIRVRRVVLPTLEEQLGPGIAEALARTADLAHVDAEALEELAAELAAAAGLDAQDSPVGAPRSPVRLDAAMLAAAPRALRWRALRLGAVAAGSPPGELFAIHVLGVDALVLDWHGQAGVDLPGHVTAIRQGTSIVLGRPGTA